MLFNCPQCGQALKAADGAAGKKCRCTSCQQLVTIPGGSPTAATPDTSKSQKNRAKPASVASELNDMIVRQHEQILQDAAEVYLQQERARLKAEQQSKAPQRYSGNQNSASPMRSIMGVAFTLLLLIGLVCCGILGFYGVPRSVELNVGQFEATAKGHGTKRVSSAGAAHGEGILNRVTGSEFWLYVTTLPNNDPAITSSIMDKFGTQSSSQQSVHRGNLFGQHFSRVEAESLNLPGGVRCEMEIFMQGNQMIVACYIPGSAKQKAGIQRKSAFEGSEEYWDQPDSFFESLQPASP